MTKCVRFWLILLYTSIASFSNLFANQNFNQSITINCTSDSCKAIIDDTICLPFVSSQSALGKTLIASISVDQGRTWYTYNVKTDWSSQHVRFAIPRILETSDEQGMIKSSPIPDSISAYIILCPFGEACPESSYKQFLLISKPTAFK